MKIKKSKKPSVPKRLLIISAVLVVLALAFLVSEMTGVTHITSLSSKKTNTQKSQTKTTTDNNKQSLIDNSSTTTTTQEPTSNDITISANREADGTATIHTQLANYSDGTCDLTITNGTETYTNSADILYQASYSTCAGFSVPANAISNGTWQISLSVTSKGKTVTKTISVEMQ